MAVFDTHQAFEAPIAAGFTERQAKALLKVGSEGYGAPATKTDLRELGLRLKHELTLHGWPWSGGRGDNRYVGTDTAIGTIG